MLPLELSSFISLSSFPCPVCDRMVLSDETLNLLSLRHVAREVLTAFELSEVLISFSLIRNSTPYQYYKRTERSHVSLLNKIF